MYHMRMYKCDILPAWSCLKPNGISQHMVISLVSDQPKPGVDVGFVDRGHIANPQPEWGYGGGVGFPLSGAGGGMILILYCAFLHFCSIWGTHFRFPLYIRRSVSTVFCTNRLDYKSGTFKWL